MLEHQLSASFMLSEQKQHIGKNPILQSCYQYLIMQPGPLELLSNVIVS